MAFKIGLFGEGLFTVKPFVQARESRSPDVYPRNLALVPDQLGMREGWVLEPSGESCCRLVSLERSHNLLWSDSQREGTMSELARGLRCPQCSFSH